MNFKVPYPFAARIGTYLARSIFALFVPGKRGPHCDDHDGYVGHFLFHFSALDSSWTEKKTQNMYVQNIIDKMDKIDDIFREII